MTDDDAEDALLGLEHQGWDSRCDGTGAKFYDDLMTDDAVMVMANGAVVDRDAIVASLEHARPWHSYEINDARLVDAGEETAAVVYVGTGYRHGDQPAVVRVTSSTYVRREGRWRLALYQQTPISG